MSSLVSDVRELPRHTHRPHATAGPRTLCGVEVMRKGRVEPFLHAHPSLSSSSVRWGGVAIEDHSVPACVIHRHEHLENFFHLVLRGSVKYEVLTRGKVLDFYAHPGTTFILPQGIIDELRWKGPTHRIAVAIHPERPKQVLSDARCSVLDVGFDIGFQNPSHFARVFRKFVGMSPSQFRNQR